MTKKQNTPIQQDKIGEVIGKELNRFAIYIRNGKEEEIDNSVNQLLSLFQKEIRKAREDFKKTDKWVKNMLFDHDGSESEYKAWLRKWDEFKADLAKGGKE